LSINKVIKFKWFDDSYSLKITMDVIDRLDDELDLLIMAGKCQSGNISLPKSARLLSFLLTEAGKEITPDEVYSELFQGLGDLTELRDLLLAVFTAIFPEPKKKSASKKQKARTKKATRGKSSTS
jgi:hypothetical protein